MALEPMTDGEAGGELNADGSHEMAGGGSALGVGGGVDGVIGGGFMIGGEALSADQKEAARQVWSPLQLHASAAQ
jgi:hypothetical protein